MVARFDIDISLRDADEVAEYVSNNFGPVNIEPVQSGHVSLLATTISIADGLAFRSYVQNGLFVRPENRVDAQLFYFLEAGSMDWRDDYGSYEASQGRGLAVDGSRLRSSNYSEGHKHVSLALPPQLCQERASMILGKPVAKPLKFVPEIDVSKTEFAGIISLIKFVTAQENTNFLSNSLIAAQRMKELLVDLLVMHWPHDYSFRLHDNANSYVPKNVRLAVDIIESDPMKIYSVTDLASQSGVSVRALQYAFERHLGVRPVEYLRNVRLKRAAAELLANPFEPVKLIANRWGFSSASRFSQYFKEKYGVTPFVFRRKRGHMGVEK